ncbi:hemolysin III family protein [Chelatococcus sp. SYSU_G07232]|uniref:Hemolysin III family protein n=2 Tax=Chelatococcus albus TaxID=3047466 RepID=A0ABT7AI81_9HYPH|nr:hemolysin III family protein [Chelatococcus sp. SYSU_G07232]MDJ1159091.1 hemolysin III family protein [Chelatococcus sp. SYSU_G07232]
MARAPSRGELIADGIVHGVGLVAALVGAGVLVTVAAMRGAYDLLPAVSIYVAGLVAMLGCSCAYNMTPPSRLKALLRRFDHAGIFLMIAGTYTPFTTRLLAGAWSVGLTSAVWTLAILGVLSKLVLPLRFDRLTVVAYLLLGWIVVVAIDPILAAASTTTLVLLAVGGLLYTVGIVFHLWQRLPFQTAIWHGFVVAAAAVHYAAVFLVVQIAD